MCVCVCVLATNTVADYIQGSQGPPLTGVSVPVSLKEIVAYLEAPISHVAAWFYFLLMLHPSFNANGIEVLAENKM